MTLNSELSLIKITKVILKPLLTTSLPKKRR